MGAILPRIDKISFRIWGSHQIGTGMEGGGAMVELRPSGHEKTRISCYTILQYLRMAMKRLKSVELLAVA